MTTRFFNYQGVEIEYEFFRKKVKNINLRISGNGTVRVSAPFSVREKTLEEFLKTKGEWIIRHLALMEQKKQLQPENKIVEGKIVYILGKPYQANIIPSQKKAIHLEKEAIYFYTNAQGEQLRLEYLEWLKKKAAGLFEELTEYMLPLLQEYEVPKPDITVRKMKTRWGSCAVNGQKITLNLLLIKADVACIEQVILHELAHFVYPNHGADFYRLLDEKMPDWKIRKARLEKDYQDGIV